MHTHSCLWPKLQSVQSKDLQEKNEEIKMKIFLTHICDWLELIASNLACRVAYLGRIFAANLVQFGLGARSYVSVCKSCFLLFCQ